MYNWFCKMHRISLFYDILMFLLSVKCETLKQCWWQVLQSLNITVLASPAHSVRKIPVFLNNEGTLFIVKVVCHVGMSEHPAQALCTRTNAEYFEVHAITDKMISEYFMRGKVVSQCL